VAKAVGIPDYLLNVAFDIRNDIIGKGHKIVKKSRYNNSKILSQCEICNYSPIKDTDMPLDTHHINFQCNADKDGFNGHFYKNSKFNLVCLCKNCHIKVHSNQLQITGYTQTSNGKILNYIKLT
jgi:DNA mismatch repair protein MutS